MFRWERSPLVKAALYRCFRFLCIGPFSCLCNVITILLSGSQRLFDMRYRELPLNGGKSQVRVRAQEDVRMGCAVCAYFLAQREIVQRKLVQDIQQTVTVKSAGLGIVDGQLPFLGLGIYCCHRAILLFLRIMRLRGAM